MADQFAAACKPYTSALATRCFAFGPSDQQLEDGSTSENNIKMFPPSDQQTLELHMLTMVQELAASLLMEFEKWVLRAESAGTILKTPLDSQASLGSEEVYSLGDQSQKEEAGSRTENNRGLLLVGWITC